MAMQLFADESGGWIGKNRNSPHSHFTFAVVWIETEAMAAACTDAIIQARITNQLGEDFEFHFAEITESQRMAFFSAISKCPFYYAASTIDNRKSQVMRGGKSLISTKGLSHRSWKASAFTCELLKLD
jgi:hypothetical protein